VNGLIPHLDPFPEYHIFKTHPCCSPSFLELDNIPLCAVTTICLVINLFICGYSGITTFWLLFAVWLWMRVHIFVWVRVLNSFRYIPRSGIAQYMTILCLVFLFCFFGFAFWGSSKLFSTVVEQFYILTSDAQSLCFFTPHTSTCYFPLVDCNCPGGCEVTAHSGFDLGFPND
jgi:hypothetical protein